MAITFTFSLKVVAIVKYSNVTWAPDVTEKSHCIQARILLKQHTSFLHSPLRLREKIDGTVGSQRQQPLHSWPWVN